MFRATAKELEMSCDSENDGVAFDSPVAIGSQTRTTNGTTYGAVYEDMSATTKTKGLVQLGVEAKCASGNALENGMASLKADIRRA